MSTTYLPSTKLGYPALNDTGYTTVFQADLTALDAMAPVGDLFVTTHEQPTSTSLLVDVAAGQYKAQDGTVATYAGVSGQAITASTTNVLYLDLTASGALVVGASYPTTPHIRLATVIAGSSTLTSITDNRQVFTVCGSWADGVNIALGSTTGSQFGTVSSQKIGFLGATPVVQQTGGSATAGASYTSTEEGMLNKCYAALRAFGFLS